MSQQLRAAPTPSRLPPDLLINGDPRAGEERLIGGDTGLAAVMTRARIVSRSSAPVLIFGETGTGKEIIARAITAASPVSPPIRRSSSAGGTPLIRCSGTARGASRDSDFCDI